MIYKKSQLKIQEMAFMIIAVVVFFVLVLLFFLVINLSGMKDSAFSSSREGAILLLSRLAGSPEFACSDSRANCVDADKLLALKNHPEYASFWGVDGLRFEKLLVDINEVGECGLGNYPFCSMFTIIPNKSNSISDSTFVSLCRKEKAGSGVYDKCELGQIVVWTQKKA